MAFSADLLNLIVGPVGGGTIRVFAYGPTSEESGTLISNDYIPDAVLYGLQEHDFILVFGDGEAVNYLAAVDSIDGGGNATLELITSVGGTASLRGPFPDNNIAISEDGLLLVTPDDPEGQDGSNNIAIGNGALAMVTSGDSTVAIGTQAGEQFGQGANPISLKSGRASVFIGHVAGQFVGPGSSNTFVGAFCGQGFDTDDVTGEETSGDNPLIGHDNSGFGEACLIRVRSTADNNCAFGFNSGFGVEFSQSNCLFGVASGFALVGVEDDVFIECNNAAYGHISYRHGKGDKNTMIGSSAGAGLSYAALNTAETEVGDTVVTLDDVTHFTVGARVYQGGTIPMDCTVTARSASSGAGTITVSKAVFNAIGTGFTWIAVPDPHTGTGNSALGNNALGNLCGDGNYNIGIGQSAGQAPNVALSGDDNIMIGRSTAASLTTGSGNILIGQTTDVTGATVSDTMNIGQTLFGTGLNSLSATGKIGIETSAPTATFDVNSDIIRLRTAKTPASAAAAGNQGDMCWDASFFYICIATNTWHRFAHASW